MKCSMWEPKGLDPKLVAKCPSALECSMWEPKRLGSQNSPMEVRVAVLGWELDVESEKVGGYIGL